MCYNAKNIHNTYKNVLYNIIFHLLFFYFGVHFREKYMKNKYAVIKLNNLILCSFYINPIISTDLFPTIKERKKNMGVTTQNNIFRNITSKLQKK